MLPRRHRLTRPAEFTAVLRRGHGANRARRAGSARLVVHRRDSPQPAATAARAGFVVSKAVGNSVVRHRVTRRLRALVASRLPDLPAGTDLVVRANPAARGASSEELAQDLDRALARVQG